MLCSQSDVSLVHPSVFFDSLEMFAESFSFEESKVQNEIYVELVYVPLFTMIIYLIIAT